MWFHRLPLDKASLISHTHKSYHRSVDTCCFLITWFVLLTATIVLFLGFGRILRLLLQMNLLPIVSAYSVCLPESTALLGLHHKDRFHLPTPVFRSFPCQSEDWEQGFPTSGSGPYFGVKSNDYCIVVMINIWQYVFHHKKNADCIWRCMADSGNNMGFHPCFSTNSYTME